MQRLFVLDIAGEMAAVCGGGRWIRYRVNDRFVCFYIKILDWLSRLWASLRVPLSRE